LALVGDIVKQYLTEYPSASTLQIAKKLRLEQPQLFNDTENARTIVRYYRGAIGKKGRSDLADESFIRPIEEALEKKYNPFGLPDSVDDGWKPAKLPFTKGRGLVVADLHIPYQDNAAITLAFQWAIDHKYTDFVLIDGDLGDHYQMSRYEKDPRQRSFRKELDDTNKLFDAISRAFPNAQIVCKYGNHDNRLERYLRSQAPALLDMDDFIKDEYLKIKERGILTVPHDVPIKVGKLNILHGHEMQSISVAVNPARGAYLKALECVLLAHCHRTSQHAETSMSGRLDTAWSIGCLCQLHPEYARLNKWNHGFGCLEIDGDDFEIENKRIVKGTVR